MADRPAVPGDAPMLLKADPAYRRRILLVYAACVLLAVVLLVAVTQWGLPMLLDYLRRSGEDGMRRLKAIALVWMVLPLLACGYLFRLGRRIQVSEQLPAPGTRVIYDTPVLRGRMARHFGTGTMVVSIATALMVVALAVRFARL